MVVGESSPAPLSPICTFQSVAKQRLTVVGLTGAEDVGRGGGRSQREASPSWSVRSRESHQVCSPLSTVTLRLGGNHFDLSVCLKTSHSGTMLDDEEMMMVECKLNVEC